MRVTAYSLLLFYVCLNMSLFAVAEGGLFPKESLPEYSTGEDIRITLLASIISAATVVALVSAVVSLIWGVTAGLVIFGLTFFIGEDSVLYWALFGFPEFLSQVGEVAGIESYAISMFSGLVLGLTSVVWFWFIIGFVRGGTVEE